MVYDRFVIDEPPHDAAEALALHNRIWTAAARTSLAYGAVLNEHHGIGWKLGRLMPELHGAAWPTLEAIKATIDPHGIINPGKVGFDIDRHPTENCRYCWMCRHVSMAASPHGRRSRRTPGRS